MSSQLPPIQTEVGPNVDQQRGRGGFSSVWKGSHAEMQLDEHDS